MSKAGKRRNAEARARREQSTTIEARLLHVGEIEEALEDPVRLFTMGPIGWVPLSALFDSPEFYMMALNSLRGGTTRVVTLGEGPITFNRSIDGDGFVSIESPELGGSIPLVLARELSSAQRESIDSSAEERWEAA